MEIKDGFVAAIFDGEDLYAVYYQEFYEDVAALAEDVKGYIAYRALKEPRVFSGKMQDGEFVPQVTDWEKELRALSLG